MEVSIIIPSFRESVVNLIKSIQEQTTVSHEIIVVGPNKYDIPGVTSIIDWGCPSRCLQIGGLLAKGRFLTWLSDDGLIIEDGIDRLVKYYEENDCIQLVSPYTEGVNFSGTSSTHPITYWRAYSHPVLHLPGIPSHYISASVGFQKTSDFLEWGGLDCRYEHINLCCNDLSYRFQNYGHKIGIPPFYTFKCDWSYQSDMANRQPVQSCFEQKDLPLLREMYGQPNNTRGKIDYNNWIYNTSSVWERRFNVNRK